MLDLAVLAFCFPTAGVGCLPFLGCSIPVFFAGTGSPSSTELSFSGVLQQFKNEKIPPFLFGLAAIVGLAPFVVSTVGLSFVVSAAVLLPLIALFFDPSLVSGTGFVPVWLFIGVVPVVDDDRRGTLRAEAEPLPPEGFFPEGDRVSDFGAVGNAEVVSGEGGAAVEVISSRLVSLIARGVGVNVSSGWKDCLLEVLDGVVVAGSKWVLGIPP